MTISEINNTFVRRALLILCCPIFIPLYFILFVFTALYLIFEEWVFSIFPYLLERSSLLLSAIKFAWVGKERSEQVYKKGV